MARNSPDICPWTTYAASSVFVFTPGCCAGRSLVAAWSDTVALISRLYSDKWMCVGVLRFGDSYSSVNEDSDFVVCMCCTLSSGK